MQYLSNLSPRRFKGKTVLVRTDFNIENTRDPASLFRIEATLPTLKYLLKAKAKIVILSHRGRPTRFLKSLSLDVFAPILAKRLKVEIDFISVYRVGAAIKAIETSKASVILLENLRFFKGEESNDPSFAREFSKHADFYVSDAFAVLHRKGASITLIPKLLPSYAGFQLEKELKYLNQAKEIKKTPFTLIIGGAKTEDKIGVLTYFSKKADWILVGGGPANTFLKAAGVPINNSIYDPHLVPLAEHLIKNDNVVLPGDWVKNNGKIVDIGPYTAEKYAEIIKSSKMIVWNGPMGQFEKKVYAKGSEKIARAIAVSKALSIVGGGETVTLVQKLKLRDKMKFISTGGGAMLDYLAGKELPGLIALKTLAPGRAGGQAKKQ